ncbi:MAG: pyridoxamine 5'-phosphate oxidase [Gammaproteobacteria bacterium]|nr:pyridoxamine 5'-phosphate oxidase [Gammaproteobacteria bacterium]MCP4091570.1 pyridoxamine 5'-phosphate oxidase [Gammaproteobacteria bacterium]MCP4276066.1 pyridoxamine 5'-phosphate oxidase [Gammaproteobacteria bacterium]MCP4832558.1 pyridoxamine 5'-phosphate oxidase [Gammaproteobacteria bacterium]MCP4929636.1 pyridoxamine 5'-phosphate oxidase [Gammaproteobacteria bacterium]
MEQLPNNLPPDPLPLLDKWITAARDDGTLPNPDAMTLATINNRGIPAARIVLCKQVVTNPGYLVFYTNYESAKGIDIQSGRPVAGVFHWDHMNRQIRFEGIAIRSPANESDAYFASREKESQIGAWASAQSQPIENRQKLKNKHIATTRTLAKLAEESSKREIPRPPFWGGYRIWLSSVELWTRGDARLHDRGRWERPLEPDGDSFSPGNWSAERLQP